MLIHENYLSQKDIEICLGFDFAGIAGRPEIDSIGTLHEVLKSEYGPDDKHGALCVFGTRMLIRSEEEKDWAAVHALNVAAFETPAEANLAGALRQQARPVVSLVAEECQAVVGHIMFSPVVLSGHPELMIMGLAPMAVAPEHQRKGIGSALVRAGLEQCKRLGCGAVVVLGHPEYYPRFGFSPSARFGIGCEYEVPEEVFMIVELQPGSLHRASGKVKYHAAFSNV